VRLEEAATEVIQEVFTLSLKRTEFPNKAVKTTSLKTQLSSHALQFRSVKTALTQKDRNLEIKAIVGLLLVIQFGKLLSTAQSQELIK